MKLIIFNKDNYKKEFIIYLKKHILTQINKFYNTTKVKQLAMQLKLNIFDILLFAVKNLKVVETSDSYIISIDKNLYYSGYNLQSLINYITYGTRDIKGYRLLYIIFEDIANNIDVIYKEWQEKWL